MVCSKTLSFQFKLILSSAYSLKNSFSSFESKVIQRLQPELDPLTQCSRRLQSLKKKDFSLQTQKCVVLQKEIVLSVLRQLMRNTGGH